jgi:hypothetical protein
MLYEMLLSSSGVTGGKIRDLIAAKHSSESQEEQLKR